MARKTNRVLQTTESEIAQINPDNIQLIEDFIQYYIATDHSPKSVVVTRSNLNIFFCYILKYLKNRHFAHVRRKDYIKFQSFLLENGLSPARIRAIRSSISSLSSYIEFNVIEEIDPDYDEEEYELWKKWKNVINSIPAPKIEQVRTKTIMEEDDVQNILNTLVEKKRFQLACLLSLAINSGARKAELVQFKVDFFDEKNLIFDGALYITPTPVRCKGNGKNGKMLQKYTLAKEFKPYLDLWLEERKRLGIDSEWLFVVKNKDGEYEQAKDTTLNSYSRTISNLTGIDFYWHSCRHNLTTRLMEIGVSATAVTELFGWSNESMVSVYNDRQGTQTLAKFFNGGEIKGQEEKSLSDL